MYSVLVAASSMAGTMLTRVESGPIAPPGTYQVRLIVDRTLVATEHFALKKDPRANATQADLAAQFAFLKQIRDRTTQANDAVKAIRWVKTQLTDREKKLTGQALDEFRPMAATLRSELSVVEDSIYQTKNRSGQDPLNYPIRLNNKIAALMSVVSSSDSAPTSQANMVEEDLATQVNVQLKKLGQILSSDLTAFNALVHEQNIPAVVPKTAK